MFLATCCSTVCILSILSDIAEYQRAGALFRVMPWPSCGTSTGFPSVRTKSSISSARFTPAPATMAVKDFCSAGVAVASNDAVSLSSSDSAVVSACCSPSPKNWSVNVWKKSARCWAASSFARDSELSVRTSLTRPESDIPCAIRSFSVIMSPMGAA